MVAKWTEIRKETGLFYFRGSSKGKRNAFTKRLFEKKSKKVLGDP